MPVSFAALHAAARSRAAERRAVRASRRSGAPRRTAVGRTVAGLSIASLSVSGAALLLTACTPVPEPEPVVVLTASEAGGVYLDAVCPLNTAWDEADVEVDRLRLIASRGDDVDAAGERLADALDELAAVSTTSAELLNAKQQEWPAAAEAAVAAVRESILDDRAEVLTVRKLDASEMVEHGWAGAAEAAASAAEARAALELPADAESACTLWAEQQSEAAEAEAAAESSKSAESAQDAESSKGARSTKGTDMAQGTNSTKSPEPTSGK